MDHYEIFVSYARKDDVPVPGEKQGWVQALCDQILADHRRFSTEPLRIFYDTREIRDMDDWRHRILGALRSSKILLVCLSPNYAASEYCRWEWEEYTRRQVHRRMGQDSVATIYFVEVPGATATEMAGWLTAVERGNFTDMRPCFPEGARALQREDVQRRVAALGQSLWERIDRARRAEKAPGNLRRQTPYFMGRTEELRRLHEHLATGAVGLVTAVHGLGGQGKTELAVAYGHTYAHDYQAGLWLLGAEGKKELLPLIGELAFAPELQYQPSDAERADGNLLGRAVLAKLGRRAEAAALAKDSRCGSSALLILDNVSEPALLSPVELAKLPRTDFLRVLATTRLGVAQLATPASALAFVEVASLQEEDALALIRDHQPAPPEGGRSPDFASSAEADCAREIVRELGGLTLAVEQVAVYLGLHPEIAPSAYLAALRGRGLASTDRLAARDDVLGNMQHEHKRISAVLDATLALLSPAACTALAFAARLPPDSVPWPWLRDLTLPRHPELARHTPDEPDPWLTLRRSIDGLRLVVTGDVPEVGRMHRLVAAHLAARAERGELERDVVNHVAARCEAIRQAQALQAKWELDALLLALPLLLAPSRTDGSRGELANQAVLMSTKVARYVDLPAARAVLEVAHHVLERSAASDPTNPDWQHGLVASHHMAGDVQIAQGDMDGALVSYGKSLAITERLASSGEDNGVWQHDLAVTRSKVGNIRLSQGDLVGAMESYQQVSAILERLTAGGCVGRWVHDLSVSYMKVGDVQVAQGDLGGALASYWKSLSISEQLATIDGMEAEWQIGFAGCHSKVGDVQIEQGDLGGALASYQKSLAVTERVAMTDTRNAFWQECLSVSHQKVGHVRRQQGDLGGALGSYRKALEISEQLATSDSSNGDRQHSLAVSHLYMGGVRGQQGDLAGALESYRSSLAIASHWVTLDERNVEWQRVLSESNDRIGDSQLGQGDLAGALASYQESLAIRERLASPEKADGRCQRDLFLSCSKVGDVQLRLGDLAGALASYRRSLATIEPLAAADTSNAGWQRDLAACYTRMGNLFAQTNQAESVGWFRKALRQLLEMKRRGLFVSPVDEQIIGQLRKMLGDVS
jgi:tetratricopeptide (TPR) repeat protein